MKKLERVLYLLNLLKNGLRINKDSVCLERGISKRTFERDIESIRNLMAEEFEGKELVYDPQDKVYYLTQTKKKTILMEEEYLVALIILLGSKALEGNEMKGLLDGLEHVSEHTNIPIQKLKEILYKQYEERLPGKPLMKIISDLMRCIVEKNSIQMQYLEDNRQSIKIEVIPIDVLFRNSCFILKAIEIEEGKETEYVIEQIEYFEVLKKKERPYCNNK